MIWALHGAVGMAEDWHNFNVRGIDLWSLLQDGEMSLSEAGKKIAAMTSDGDTLVGYSMGGRLALHTMAHRHWKQVILISTHPGLRAGHEERLVSDEAWAQKAEGDWEQFLMDWNAQAILPEVSWGDRGQLKARQEEIARSFRCWSLGRQERFDDFPESVTWVVGERDSKFRNLAPADAIVVPDAGHRVPWEQPEALKDLIK